MNIEIANRLVRLRKEKGYSQEDLADKLGISRQAISKWERAEASPDTENLILLARLYNMSLDELLKTEETSEDIREESKEKEKEKETTHVSFKNGIHVESAKDHVHVSLGEIHVVEEDGDEVHIDGQGIRIRESKGEEKHFDKKELHHSIASGSIVGTLTVIVYLLLGFVWNLWHPGWIVFLAVPIFTSLIEAINNKRIKDFAYPVLVVVVYLVLGFVWNLWHPSWIVFLTIPVYYSILDGIKRSKENKKLKDIEINIENDEEKK